MAITPIFVRDTSDLTIPAGAVYAAPNGVSGNAGTAASPKDLASAYAATPANGTLVLSGTLTTPYRASLNINKKITILAKPGSDPVLLGSVVFPASDFTLESGDIYFKDYTSAYPAAPAEYVDPKTPQAGNLQQVFINGVYQKQVGSKAALAANTFFFNGSRLYIKGNPAGKTIEVSNKQNGITISSGGSGTRIAGITVAHFGNYGIYITATATLDRVNVFYSGFRNFFVPSGTGTRILNSGSYYAGCTGVRIGITAKDFLMEGGDIVGSNIAGFANYYDASALKMTSAYSDAGYPLPDQGIRIIKGVKVADNNCHGIWLDNNVLNAQVTKNIVSGNLAGIIVEISADNAVVDNICFNNSNGVLIQNSKRTTVANNTLVLNNRAIVVRGTGRTNTNAAQVNAGLDWKTEANKIYNNIIDRTPSTGSSAVLLETDLINQGTQAITELRNNAYNRDSTTQPVNLIKWKNAAGAYNFYDTLTEIQQDFVGYEAGSIGRTGVTSATSHPYFEAGTMVVKAGSPTLNAGSTVSGLVATLLGVPSGTKVSIGSTLSSSDVIEPPAACSVEIAEAIAPIQTQLNLLNDDFNAQSAELTSVRGQLATATASVTSLTADKQALTSTLNTRTLERDAAQAQVVSLQQQLDQADTTSAAKLAEVKTQLTATLTYIG